MNRPDCYNRPTFNVGFWSKLPDQPGAKPRYKWVWNNWFKDRCASWDVLVQGDMYTPKWERWDCEGCKWNPGDNHERFNGRKLK